MIIYHKNKRFDFWLPSFKYELIEWLQRYYPVNKKNKLIDWSTFSKNQLTKIYIKKRISIENENKIPNKEKEKNSKIQNKKEENKIQNKKETQIEFTFI